MNTARVGVVAVWLVAFEAWLALVPSPPSISPLVFLGTPLLVLPALFLVVRSQAGFDDETYRAETTIAERAASVLRGFALGALVGGPLAYAAYHVLTAVDFGYVTVGTLVTGAAITLGIGSDYTAHEAARHLASEDSAAPETPVAAVTTGLADLVPVVVAVLILAGFQVALQRAGVATRVIVLAYPLTYPPLVYLYFRYATSDYPEFAAETQRDHRMLAMLGASGVGFLVALGGHLVYPYQALLGALSVLGGLVLAIETGWWFLRRIPSESTDASGSTPDA